MNKTFIGAARRTDGSWAAPLLMLLSACTTAGSGVEGIKQAADAEGLMLTSAPAATVSQCVARLLNVQPEQRGADYWVTPAGTGLASYRIRTIADPLGRYATQVDIVGRSSGDNAPEVARCL